MECLSVSPKAPNLLRNPPHPGSLFLPTPVAKMALKLSPAFGIERFLHGFRSSLLFAISCGSCRPGSSNLPLLHTLQEILYSVIGLHRLQTTGTLKIPLEGLFIHTTLTERESVSMQESMMCLHMIDPISALSDLPRRTDTTLPKLEARVRWRYTNDSERLDHMVS